MAAHRESPRPPDVSVDGEAVTTIVRAIRRGCGHFEDRAREILESNGIENPRDGDWYALEDYLDAYDELLTTTGEHTVHRIGKELAQVLSWEPGTETVADALSNLDEAYGTIHSGNAGSYDFERTGAETGRLVCRTSYPVELEEGLLRGIAQRFSDTGYVAADHVETTREDGMTVTTLEVTWWQSTDVGTPTVTADSTGPRPVAGD